MLNGSSHPVSDATRNRVLAAAEELGYRPSELARALVKRTSRIVGVIVGDIVDPYFAEIARGVDHVAAAAGHLTMVCNTDRRPEAELAHLGVLLDYHAAGVVFAGSGYENAAEAAALRSVVQDMQARGSAVVALARATSTARACSSTTTPPRATRPSTCSGSATAGSPSSRARPGCTPARTASRDSRRRWRRRAPSPLRLPGGFEYEAGDAAADALLAAGELPDAILAVNDEVAIGLLTGLRRAGVDIPGQVSLAGIDDTRPARLVDLTSVSLPLQELGERAARLILEGGGGDVVLPHRLVPRGTTAARS